MEVIPIIANICFGLGAFFILTSALGFYRMPDFFTRLHPAGMSDSAGILFIGTGAVLTYGLTLVSAKIVILAFFAMITSATATHALGSAALSTGLKPKGRNVTAKKPAPKKKAKKK